MPAPKDFEILSRAPAIQAIFADYGKAVYDKTQDNCRVFDERKSGNCVSAARVLLGKLHKANNPSCLWVQNIPDQGIHMAAALFVDGGRLETAELYVRGLVTRAIGVDVPLVDGINNGSVVEACYTDGEYRIKSAAGPDINAILVPPSISDSFARLVVEGYDPLSPWSSVLAATSLYQQAA